MTHANAALTSRHGLKVARLVVRRRAADQRGRSPIPGLLADNEAVSRPLPRRRLHARPLRAAEDFSEQERHDALQSWLHHKQHRLHTACENQPRFSRLINVPEQYNSLSSVRFW